MECLEWARDQGQVPAEDVGLGMDQSRDRVVDRGMEQLMNTLHTRDLRGVVTIQRRTAEVKILTRISKVTSRITMRSALY